MSAHSAILERGFRYSTIWCGAGLRGWVLKGGFFFCVCLVALPCLIVRRVWVLGCVVVLDEWFVGWSYHGGIVIRYLG